jgi:hypothetical protein
MAGNATRYCYPQEALFSHLAYWQLFLFVLQSDSLGRGAPFVGALRERILQTGGRAYPLLSPMLFDFTHEFWSERRDLNSGPPVPRLGRCVDLTAVFCKRPHFVGTRSQELSGLFANAFGGPLKLYNCWDRQAPASASRSNLDTDSVPMRRGEPAGEIEARELRLN